MIPRPKCDFGGGWPPSTVLAVSYGIFGFSTFYMLVAALRVHSPVVIYDELAYLLLGKGLRNVSLVHELAPSVPQLNNFLYLRILHLLDRLGMPLDSAAKLFNVFCISSANWLLIRHILLKDQHVHVTLPIFLICFFPTTSFAAYIMPEAMYYAGFVFACHFLLSDFDPRSVKRLLPSTLLLAALTLIKPHAMMIFGSLIGSLLLFCLFFDRPHAKRYLLLVATITSIYASSVVMLKWILTPTLSASYDVVGTFYWGMIMRSVPTLARVQEFLSTYALYLSWFGALYTPLLFMGLREVASRKSVALEPGQRSVVLCGLFLSLTTTIILTVVVYIISFETDRVHFRYVSFIFPVFLTYIFLARSSDRTDGRLATVVLSLSWLIAIGAATMSLAQFRPLAIDAPELFAFYAQIEFGQFAPTWIRSAILASLAGFAVLVFFRRTTPMAAQFWSLSLVFVISLWNVQGSQTAMNKSPLLSGFRDIGTVANLLCGKSRDAITLIGQTNLYVPLAYSLYSIGHPSRFAIIEPGDIDKTVDDVTPSTCLLTTFALPSEKATLLFSVPALWLYRRSH